MAEDNNILDFYPDGEEDSCAEDSYVTLVDDEGNEVEMSVVDIVEHLPAPGRCHPLYVIFRFSRELCF